MGLNHYEYKTYLRKEIGISHLTLKVLFNYSSLSVYYIRRSQYLYSCGGLRKKISKIYTNKLIRKFGIFVHPNSNIGCGLKLPHPNGIIIGESVVIGENCTIYQQVTIGSAHVGDYKKGRQPQIKDNCILFSGSKIIGDIVLENNTVVGANAVLTKNTENNSIYAGIPAKRINK